MKTSMFKKYTKEERRNKIENILRKKTNQQITEDMLNAIFTKVDMSNQLFIEFYDRTGPDKFDGACALNNKFNAREENSIVEVVEKGETIYGDLFYGSSKTVLYNKNKPQIVLKTRNNVYSNQTSDWDYILLIYIPEEK